jgi:putative transposase
MAGILHVLRQRIHLESDGPLGSENGVELDFSRPGKPTDNAKVESFNGRFRSECLNAHWFLSLDDAKRKIEAWRQYYNEIRPPLRVEVGDTG